MTTFLALRRAGNAWATGDLAGLVNNDDIENMSGAKGIYSPNCRMLEIMTGKDFLTLPNFFFGEFLAIGDDFFANVFASAVKLLMKETRRLSTSEFILATFNFSSFDLVLT